MGEDRQISEVEEVGVRRESCEERTDKAETTGLHEGVCPVCTGRPRGILCKEHRRELARIIHDLRMALYELSMLAARKTRQTDGVPGAKPAFPSAPLEMGAADLYQEVEEIIRDVAADIGVWGGRAPGLLNKLSSRLGRLAQAPHVRKDYLRLADALHRVQMRVAPREDRIMLGRCLNPRCKAELKGLATDTAITCRDCGSVWSVEGLHRARRQRLAGRSITGTPTQVAAWVKSATGVQVKGQNVKDWIRRGQVGIVSKRGRGIYECSLPDLLRAAESAHPGVKLTR